MYGSYTLHTFFKLTLTQIKQLTKYADARKAFERTIFVRGTRVAVNGEEKDVKNFLNLFDEKIAD